MRNTKTQKPKRSKLQELEDQPDPLLAIKDEEPDVDVIAAACGLDGSPFGFGDIDINAVQDRSYSICYNCNQKGHFSPQRPNGKGKGNNNKGKGKGGKGFQGKGYGQFQPK